MMDKRTMIALGIIASAAFGWYWFKVRGQSTTSNGTTTNANAAQDQSLAMAEQANYTTPPSSGIQSTVGDIYTTQNGVTTVQSRQTMPLPYNT